MLYAMQCCEPRAPVPCCSEYTDLGQFLVVDMLICAFSGSMTVMAAKGLAMFLREVRPLRIAAHALLCTDSPEALPLPSPCLALPPPPIPYPPYPSARAQTLPDFSARRAFVAMVRAESIPSSVQALQGDRSMFHDWVVYALFGVLGVTVVIQARAAFGPFGRGSVVCPFLCGAAPRRFAANIVSIGCMRRLIDRPLGSGGNMKHGTA